MISVSKLSVGRPRKVKRQMFNFYMAMLHNNLGRPPKFVQVGANDGILADPLRGFLATGRWHGLMIEPHPTYCAELRQLYARFTWIDIENYAISDETGTMELYALKPEMADKYPVWAKGCASLKSHRLFEAIGQYCEGGAEEFATHVERIPVPTRRLGDVLEEKGIDDIDFLIVDVEGFEVNVLRSVDLKAIAPIACLIECNGTDIPSEGILAGELAKAGLRTFRMGDDLLAVDDTRLTIHPSTLLSFVGFNEIAPETP